MPVTHTFATLELSPVAYAEIREKLKAAGYEHAFMESGIIDMHGIGVAQAGEPAKMPMVDQVLFYFGCIGRPGHYLFQKDEQSADVRNLNSRWVKAIGLNPAILEPRILDGLFVPTGSGYRESIIPPARIVSWMDNSVDHRGGSHSTFIGFGYGKAEEMLDDAIWQFPSVMRRQPRPRPEGWLR